jgi:glutathione synthase/RimK-type ligase-like ATP-grasp enzyme
MQRIVIVDSPSDWPLNIPDVEVVSGMSYLTSAAFRKQRHVRVFNMCKSYKYQTIGYYVSLLAAARGHRPIPSVATIQDMKSQAIVKLAGDELEEIIQKTLADEPGEEFTLSIYFGKNLERRYDRLASQVYRNFHAPFVRALFAKEQGKWRLRRVGPIAAKEIPADHHEDVIDFAKEYFQGKRSGTAKRPDIRYSMAILTNDKEELPPSDDQAIKRFIRAAEKLHMETEIINRDDYSRIGEFDALFIRETTAVNHHTFRFARRAAAEGLVVIDDPDSILKCTNKVYLNELLEKNQIPAPRTMIVNRENMHEVLEKVGLPCVLKQPDSSFSQGVCKVEDKAGFDKAIGELFEKSDLIIAQEFLPTEYDWRIGIFDGKPLYLCKYYMAKKDWKILTRDETGKAIDGKSETMPVELGPRKLISMALKAANLIGNGLYGIDAKQIGNQFYIIEINDNPSIEHNVEDAILKDDLYTRIMEVFLRRITDIKEGRAPHESR